jgi:diaminopimelate epimerase
MTADTDAFERPHLFRAHGHGNDYLACDAESLPFALTPAAVRLICHRHRGVGSEGLLAIVPADGADFGVRIFNPDGSEAEKSGNGLRIVAACAHALGRVRAGEPFAVHTLDGGVTMCLTVVEPGVWSVDVEMGRARFLASEIGLDGPDREAADETFDLEGEGELRGTGVSIGNPHLVVFRDRLDPEAHRPIAARLSTHPRFARGANVQFARVEAPGRIAAWVWERGAGETEASGSSACAVASAAVRRGLVAAGDIEVHMPGGVLEVLVREDWTLRLRGPVEEVGWIRLGRGFIDRCAAAH